MNRGLRRQLPPGPRVASVVQLMATWTRPIPSLLHLGQKYGRRFTVQLPFQPPFVILSDPEDIRELFAAPPDVIHPGEGASVLEPVVGRNSVILLDEDTHLAQRRLMLPAFHGQRMQRLTGLMEELAAAEVDSWPRGEPLQLHPRLQRVTLEIILRAVFGLEQGPQLDELRDLVSEVLVWGESPLSVLPALRPLARHLPSVRRFDATMVQADRLIFRLIDERRAATGEGSEPREDILAMLLDARHEDQSPMSPQELRDELMTALVAGHETTASQLAWGFDRLAHEPRVMKRLREEIDEGESDEYLTATINEILRIRPVLPNAEPRLTMRPVEIGGFRYPAGVALLASAFLVHHDPEIYPQPEAFRPERFLEKPPGTYTWIPFGGGRRRCLGASFALTEMKIVLRAVLSRYELEAGGKRRETARRRSITFSPARGATVVLADRVPHVPPVPVAAAAG
jgi:cytochrome P450